MQLWDNESLASESSKFTEEPKFVIGILHKHIQLGTSQKRKIVPLRDGEIPRMLSEV